MQCCDGTTWIPQVGMEFQTEEEAWQFWTIYSLKTGFNARKRNWNKSRIDGATTSMLYVCSHEGKRAKDKRDWLTKKPRAETRTNCMVRLGVRFIRETNRFKVVDFVSDHNHPLRTPVANPLLHCQCAVPATAARGVEPSDETGEWPKQTHEQNGRQNGVPTNPSNIRDHRKDKSKLVGKEDDAGGLCNDIEKLWEKGEMFDVIFEVEREGICAHSLILAARSPVFKNLLFGPMARARTECIKIDEMKAEVFKALLHFMYTDKLAKDGAPPVELLQDLFTAADRFSLKKLTLLCEKHLEMNLSVDTVVTTLLWADQHGHTELKKKCLEFASSPKNFYQVAVTQAYLNIMPQSPSLLAELIEKVNSVSPFAKKLKTG